MKKIIILFLIAFLFIFSCKKDYKTNIMIYKSSNAQTEIISPQGVRVLIDVVSTRSLSKPATSDDILLTTHSHPDHINEAFRNEFKGETIYIKEGKIKRKDVEIESIASLHSSQGKFQKVWGSNYIFIIKIGELKIAHFGDIGQEKFTGSQLRKLKNTDVAIMQFHNGFSGMDVNNKKGFKLMKRINPKIIIPAHINKDAANYSATVYDAYYKDNPLLVNKNLFNSDKIKIIFLGNDIRNIALSCNFNELK